MPASAPSLMKKNQETKKQREAEEKAYQENKAQQEAKLAKFHNDANILAMSYKNDINDLIECINMFIITDFAKEERHIRRINMISDYEREN